MSWGSRSSREDEPLSRDQRSAKPRRLGELRRGVARLREFEEPDQLTVAQRKLERPPPVGIGPDGLARAWPEGHARIGEAAAGRYIKDLAAYAREPRRHRCRAGRESRARTGPRTGPGHDAQRLRRESIRIRRRLRDHDRDGPRGPPVRHSPDGPAA